MPIDTIPPTYRVTKGSELTHVEGDANFRNLYNGIQSLAALLGVALNNDGSLKDGAIASTDVFDATVLASLQSIPVGFFMMGGVATPPTNFLLCDGSLISRTTYATLFAKIGTTYGVGDGLTTFGLPDPRGRALMAAGSGAGLTARALNASGGTEEHTLTADESAVLTYTVTSTEAVTTDDATSQTTNPQILYAGRNQATVSYNPSMTIGSDAGGNAHNNMPPYLAVGHLFIRYQ
jgi:microcystin-dependent protein